MFDATLENLLNVIAAEVVAGDAEDEDSLQIVAGLSGQLAAMLSEAGDDDTASKVCAVRDRIALGIAEPAARDPHGFDDLSTLVSELRDGAQPSQPEPKATEPGEPLELPSWVDETTFTDFLATQSDLPDELEREILAGEKDPAGARRSILGRFHTLKGEAGVLGLYGLQQVCHAVEDYLSGCAAGSAETDRLLSTADWISEAFSAYARRRHPERTAEAMCGVIGEWMAASDGAPAEVTSEPQGPTTEQAEPAPVTAEADDPWLPVPSAAPPKRPTSSLEPVQRDAETVVLIGEFLQEAAEGLATADQILMDVDRGDANAESVNGLFRVFHTIKGIAGFFELEDVSTLAHQTETMLNHVREGAFALEGAVLGLVFDATGMMRAYLEETRMAVECNLPFESLDGADELLARLEAASSGVATAKAALLRVETPEPVAEVRAVPDSPIATSDPAVDGDAKETGARRGTPQPIQKIRDTVKVDLERVDTLVEMIGELVIVEAMVQNAPEIAEMVSPRVRKYLSQFTKITRDLQSVGMRMRMIPVRGVFQKMARMVRDLAHKSNKNVRLVPNGESTEMDRRMVEQLADPLVHMIRNAVDHGIEPPAERLAAGKPASGSVLLSAHHEGGSIVVEVQDDGRGLSRERILAKARSKGIVGEGEPMTDSDVWSLIFAPGFSTAEKVTEISGRGVGMDVVRRSIEAMRGRVSIASVPGHGTTFKIILPLTLAIIDGMLVACGDERYIIPTLNIVESIRPTADMLLTLGGRVELARIRGATLPMLRLSSLFDVEEPVTDPLQGLIVVVESAGRKMGLMVDDVVRQQQVVIKSVETALSEGRFLSGAAILSDGHVGLIIDVDEIGGLVDESRFRRLGHREGSQDSRGHALFASAGG